MDKDRYEAFSNLVTSALKSLNRIKSKGMLPYGLSSTHTTCMRRLYESSGGLTRAQLAKLCYVDKAQVSRIVNELTEKGYVTSSSGNAVNYRSKLILTESGKTTTAEINDTVLKINNFVSGDISDEDIDIFYRTLQQICDNLKKAELLLDPQ